MQITDSLTLDASGLTFTRDGYLVGDAKVSRAGNVQVYLGSEIGLTGEDAGRTFGVYRDPDVVFDQESMLSLAGRPVTREHPQEGVTAANWRDLAVGQVGGTIRRDGEYVVAPMAIMDSQAAKEVGEGARSLSAGYTAQIIADEGVAPDGTPYQYRQAGPLRFNHVAYLPSNNPRAGNTRIGDAANLGREPITKSRKEDDMSDALKTVVLGDEAVQVSAADVAIIEKFKGEERKKLTDAEAAHAKAVADKDAEIAKKDAEIDDLKAKVLSDADLDARVQARADLIAKAKAIAPQVVTDGKSDAEIRKAAVVARLGDAAIEGKADAYVDARFDILAEEKKDAFKDAVKGAPATNTSPDADKAYRDMTANLRDAWKGQSKEVA